MTPESNQAEKQSDAGLLAIIGKQHQEILDLHVQIDALGREKDRERRQLWCAAAVAASHQFLDEKQPARVADAVLAEFDERWGGKVPHAHQYQALMNGTAQCVTCGVVASAPPQKKDPVDSILSAFGVDRVEVDPL